MIVAILGLLLPWVMMLVAATPGAAQTIDPGEFFETRIRPVLANNCNACHTNSQLGGLRVDSRESLLKGGKSGPAILPGKPEESLLIRAVRQVDENLKMPMGSKLKHQEIADLAAWVRMGAPWPETQVAQVAAKDEATLITTERRTFWSFEPIQKPVLAAVNGTGRVESPVDRFILSRLEARGLEPVKAADKTALIRRASFDLTGLPPTPEELQAFLKDSSPGAFAKVVDRLLESPHYGERWGRYWLDVARYAEDDVRAGIPEGRELYPNAWRYRDWVIRAFNQDMPYDLFVKAQLAGDLLDRENGARNNPLSVSAESVSFQGRTRADRRDAPLHSSQRENDGRSLQNPGETQGYTFAPGTGFLGLGPWIYDNAPPPEGRANERDDRIDALTRGFLGLTVACARCHDHKYDPISTKDYYALAGVFLGTEYAEYPLAPQAEVIEFKERQKKTKSHEAALSEFIQAETTQLGEILARKTSQYMVAVWEVLMMQRDVQHGSDLNQPAASGESRLHTSPPTGTSPQPPPSSSNEGVRKNALPSAPPGREAGAGEESLVRKVAEEKELDTETLERWVKYLMDPLKEHPYLQDWNALVVRGGTVDEARRVAGQFQKVVLTIIAEKKEADEENRPILAQAKRRQTPADVLLPNRFVTYEDYCPGCSDPIRPLERNKLLLWRDLFVEQKSSSEEPSKKASGVLLYKDEKLDRFLSGEWKSHLAAMRTELEQLKKDLPPQYPYVHGACDTNNPGNSRLHLRGSPLNLGEEVPRRFLAVLSQGEPAPFSQGSGRLELAEAVAHHPLTARVIVNRAWYYHFGRGIVATPSNFGQLGERPTHPELLEYLAGRFIAGNYSIKKLHREIMLSATYQLSSEFSERNLAEDPDNRLYWRSNHRRLDAEALRDALLFVSGSLDMTIGGPSAELTDDNRRRTVYASISRFKPNTRLATFDFPDARSTSEKRNITHVPLQRLFFLNSGLIWFQADHLAKRLADSGTDDMARIKKAYQLLYAREAADSEVQLGLDFIQRVRRTSEDAPAWRRYAQVLLSANEFLFVD